jgi:uncharacterized protein YgiM (DUF1202 family)
VNEASEQSRPEVVDVREGPEAGTIIRMTVPWVLLAIVLLIVVNIFGQYRTAQSQADRAAPASSGVRVESAPSTGSKATSSATDTKQATATNAPKVPVVVVIMDGVNFRESANNSSAVIEALNQGARLTWLATEGRWYKARDAKGRMGYVSANPTLTQKR